MVADARRVPEGERRLRVDDVGEGARHAVEAFVVHFHRRGPTARRRPRRRRRRRAGAPTTDRRRATRGRCARAPDRTSGRCARARRDARPRRRRGRGTPRPSARGSRCARAAGCAPRRALRRSRARTSVRRASGSRRAVSAGNPSWSAIDAPRSQRISDQLARRVRSARDGDELSRTRSRSGWPGATARAVSRASRTRACQSTLFMRGLTRLVVGPEQRGHAARVARAAGVLEEQRVVERRALIGSRPIASAMRIPIRQVRMECPAGAPSVRSSAHESAESTSERLIRPWHRELLRDAARATMGDDFRDRETAQFDSALSLGKRPRTAEVSTIRGLFCAECFYARSTLVLTAGDARS